MTPSRTTRRSRMVFAFVEVETPQDRMWRQAASEMSVDEIMAEGRKPRPKPFYDGGHTPEGRLRFWCAADSDEIGQGDDFRLAPVYRTSKVPADAVCEECGIGIREIQELFA